MKLIPLFLCSCLLTCTCSSSDSERRRISYWPNGTIKSFWEETVDSCEIKREYHPNGVKKSEAKHEISGRLLQLTEWDEDGNIRQQLFGPKEVTVDLSSMSAEILKTYEIPSWTYNLYARNNSNITDSFLLRIGNMSCFHRST